MSGAAWAVFIPFLLAAISSFALLAYFWQEWQKRKRLLDPMQSVIVQADIKAARIERPTKDKPGLSRHVIDCEFKDWNGALHSTCYAVSESEWAVLKDQPTVSVTYLRETPQIHSLTDQIHNKIHSYRFLVIALTVSPLFLLSMGAFYAASEN